MTVQLIKSRTRQRRQERRWRRNNREKTLNTRLKGQHGITLAEYRALVVSQDGRCGICKRLPKEGKRLQVDHDHRSGKFRGLLCWDCNVAVGKLGDSLEGLQAAVAYMAKV